MGANGSTPGNQGGGGGGPIDHYTVLGIERTATDIEIKKAFRSLALKEHPDKNPQDVEGANLRFSRIQEAYEVLSDPQEKTWYDDHLDQLLNNSSSSNENINVEEDMNYFDQLRKGKRKTKAQEQQEQDNNKGGRPDKGLQTIHLMKFFNTTSWSGFDDSPTGFFTTFSTLFSILSSDEFFWSSPHYYPSSFGTSHTPTTKEQIQDLRNFYSTWLNFQTEKDFSWKDEFRIEKDMPRYMRREIEKENLKIRSLKKREYNETVRNLVLFVRRRDPRYKAIAQLQADESLKIKADLIQASKLRALEREKLAQEYQAQLQDWEKGQSKEGGSGGGLESVLREWEEGSELDDNQDNDKDNDDDDQAEEEDERVWCEACNKGYRSGGAWEDHERSRKHIKNLNRLIKEMQEQDELLGLDQTEPPPPLTSTTNSRPPVSPNLSIQEDIDLANLSLNDSDDQDEVTPQQQPLKKKKKDKKNKKKKNVFSSLPVSDNDDDDLLDSVDVQGNPEEVEEEEEEEEEGIHGDLGRMSAPSSSSRKNKKKKGKSKGIPLTDDDQEEEGGRIVTPIRGIESDDENLVGGSGGGGKRGKKGKRRTGKTATTTTTTTSAQSSRPQSRTELTTATNTEEAELPPPLGKEEEILEEEMSKKDKRRAREAAKKEAASKGSQVSCNVCQESFPSRSKLFNHINDTGHALAEGFSLLDGGAGGGVGKKKRGKR
ncbi:hypothetical protein JCM3765_002789 [Sporobolomyces pararoseus]